MSFCGLWSRCKRRDEPYQKSTRPVDGVITGQQAISQRKDRSKAEQFNPKPSRASKPPIDHGLGRRSASTSSAYTPQTQVRTSSLGSVEGDTANYRKSPTAKRSWSTHNRVSTPSGPGEGKQVTQFHSLPDVHVSTTSSVTEAQPSRDFRQSYNEKAADPREITNTSKLPLLGINDRSLKGHGKEHLYSELKQTGNHSVSLQKENAHLKQDICQHLRSTEGEKEVQNLRADIENLRSENINLKKEVKKLLDIDREGYELIEHLQNEIKRLTKENKTAVKDFTNTVSDLESQKKYISDLECIQVENDRLKGECDKLKGTVRKLGVENNNLQKELGKTHGLSPGESTKITKPSVSQSDLLDQIHECEMHLNAKKTEIKQLEQELEEESSKGRHLIHDKQRLTVELKKLARRNAELKRNVSELENRNENLERSLSEVQKQNEHSKKSMDVLHSKHAKIKMELEDENNKLRQDLSGLLSQYQSLELEYNDFRQASSLQIQERDDKLKESSIRISKLVAENVGRSNPYLEDLSSQNRSMKIAERFRGDLYGDIWCDALDLLIDNEVPEEDALKIICDTLLAVYKFCRDHSARVVQSASSSLVNLSYAGLDSPFTEAQETGGNLGHLHSTMKDYLRASAMGVTPDKLLQLYASTSGAGTSPHSVALQEFTRQALAICWCMVTQDPPMSLAYTLSPGGAYDPSSFKTYSSSGNRAKFLVWPALLLTDTGPLMEKGVVYT